MMVAQHMLRTYEVNLKKIEYDESVDVTECL